MRRKNYLYSEMKNYLITALRNITVNACKYSDNHLAVVRLVSENNQIIIYIEDEGRGIPEEELKNIFQPFYRVSNNRNIKGFGWAFHWQIRL